MEFQAVFILWLKIHFVTLAGLYSVYVTSENSRNSVKQALSSLYNEIDRLTIILVSPSKHIAGALIKNYVV